MKIVARAKAMEKKNKAGAIELLLHHKMLKEEKVKKLEKRLEETKKELNEIEEAIRDIGGEEQ